MKKPMTDAQRADLMYAVGQDYAMHGTRLRSMYASDADAFNHAANFAFYQGLAFTALDFPKFATGYADATAVLHAARKLKADALVTIKSVLADVGYTSQSYIYDTDKPAPFVYDKPCLACKKIHDKCGCQRFRPTPNPAYKKKEFIVII